MAKPERDIINKRLLALAGNERLFRINSGTGWVGTIARKTPGMIILKNPRPLHAAPAGWPDLTGWTTVEITPDMVGQKIAVFTAEEVKTSGRLSPEQKRFRDVIESMGGIYRIIS